MPKKKPAPKAQPAKKKPAHANGAAKATPTPYHEQTLAERYVSVAQHILEEDDERCTAARLRSLHSETRNGKPCWTDAEHADAWALLCWEHPGLAETDEEKNQEDEALYALDVGEQKSNGVVQVKPSEVRAARARRAAEPDDPFAGEIDGVGEDDLGDDYPDDDELTKDVDEPDDDDAPAGTEYLLHAFTDAEVLQKRLQREELDVHIDQLVADQKVAASEAASLRKQIEAMSKAGREITRSIKSRGEMKYVPVEPRKETSPNLPQAVVDKLGHPPAGELVMVTYRLDTNEAISWRALKPIEKQGQLFDDAPAATPAGVEVRTNLGDVMKDAGVAP
jgi:hypothetical protein